MKFSKMVDALFKDNHKIAYNTAYPHLLANVRVRHTEEEMSDAGNRIEVLFYYSNDTPTQAVSITGDLWRSEGWEVIDDYSERLNIANFINMPNAKSMLKELYALTDKKDWDGKFPEEFVKTDGYMYRFREAMALRIIYGDLKNNRLVFTDIGEDLMKTL